MLYSYFIQFFLHYVGGNYQLETTRGRTVGQRRYTGNIYPCRSFLIFRKKICINRYCMQVYLSTIPFVFERMTTEVCPC